VLTCVGGKLGHDQLGLFRRELLAMDARRGTSQFVNVGLLHRVGVSFDGIAVVGANSFTPRRILTVRYSPAQL